jgi:hypothetical protein
MPSDERVKRALEQLGKSGANRKYFFEKLSSPEWIEPLAKAGLFLHPPPAVRSADSVSFSFWPESRFLVRVAGAAPDQVLKVISKVPATDNVRVHEDFVDAALMMPPESAAKIAQKEAKWLAGQDAIYSLLPDKVGELAVRLARGDRPTESLSLLKAVLTLGKPRSEREIGEAKIDDWHYGQVIQKYWPDVFDAIGERALWVLSEILENGHGPESGEVFSSAWRRAIEEHEQNHGFGDPEDHLLEAIRDGFRRWLGSNPRRIPETLAILEKKGSELFRRLALHLASEMAGKDIASAQARLLDRDAFKNAGLHHEYSVLMKTVFPLVEPAARDTVLGWIRDEANPSDTADDDARRMADRWLWRRLSIIRPHLSGDLGARYEDLVRAWGEPEYPDLLAHSTRWVGPVSPMTAGELGALPLDEVARYLSAWQSPETWQSPTREGLARELTKMVQARMEEVCSNLTLFQTLDPTYSRAIVEGLSEAFRAGASVAWPEVLTYFMWIVERDRAQTFDAMNTMDRDPHWGWARKAVARLIEIAVGRGAIPTSLAEVVWTVLEPITDDPDPVPEDDVDTAGDVVHRSINSTRPVSFHTAMAVTSWLRTARDSEPGKAGPVNAVVAKMLADLDRHLDPTVDPSPAVRSVYGQYFEWLLHLDGEWLRARIGRVFSKEQPQLREAAWMGYLARARVRNEVFSAIREEYEVAVEKLVTYDGENRSQIEAARHLAEHLMILVGRGILTPGDSLLTRFFAVAPPVTRAYAIGYVGRALNSERVEVDESFVANWKTMWEWRHALATPAADAQEDAEFGWWFSSGRFDLDWSLAQFIATLRRSGPIPAEPFISERLAKVAAERPGDAIQVLDLMANLASSDWGLLGLRRHGAAILRAGLADPASRAHAEAVIHRLGAKGYMEFRGLLSEQRQPADEG